MTIILCPSFVNSFARKPGQMNDNLLWTLHCCTFNGVRFAALKLELRTDPNSKCQCHPPWPSDVGLTRRSGKSSADWRFGEKGTKAKCVRDQTIIGFKSVSILECCLPVTQSRAATDRHACTAMVRHAAYPVRMRESSEAGLQLLLLVTGKRSCFAAA